VTGTTSVSQITEQHNVASTRTYEIASYSGKVSGSLYLRSQCLRSHVSGSSVLPGWTSRRRIVVGDSRRSYTMRIAVDEGCVQVTEGVDKVTSFVIRQPRLSESGGAECWGKNAGPMTCAVNLSISSCRQLVNCLFHTTSATSSMICTLILPLFTSAHVCSASIAFSNGKV
jgi:hypothetical protein